METELTKFPCPICGRYYEPYMVSKKGVAMMECDEHGLFQTSVKVSKNFRVFCSKIAQGDTRSQGHYTSGEEKIRQYLLSKGLREGFDFIHNCRVSNGSGYYWLDFYIPRRDLVLEYSPSIWHEMWNRQSSEEKKYSFLQENVRLVIILGDEDLKRLEALDPFLEGSMNISGVHRLEGLTQSMGGV